MEKEKNGILTRKEQLWDVSLRGIGIQLPDEYVIRFVGLLTMAKNCGIDKLTIGDMTDIENNARQSMEYRLKAKEERDEQN